MKVQIGMGMLGAVLAIGLGVAPALAANKPNAEDVANINNARADVHKAIIDLWHASHDFHGHRAKAVKFLRGARHQLALCAAVDDKNEEAEENAEGKVAAGKKINPKAPHTAEPHPLIDAAIRSMDRAIVDLKDSHRVYGGHRGEALKQCQEAKKQLLECLAADAK